VLRFADPAHVRWVSLLASVATLAASLVLVHEYRSQPPLEGPGGPVQPRMEWHQAWMTFDQPQTANASAAHYSLEFFLGVDGISVSLIVLTTLLTVSSIFVSWTAVTDRVTEFHVCLLLLETGMIGVFCAFDLVLFYVFFEFTLVPLFFLVGIWGGPQRRYAAGKFFVYTLAGSMVTLLGLAALVVNIMERGTLATPFSIPDIAQELARNPLPANLQWALFLALSAGFMIKVPLFPFHTWLPDAHTDAPTAGSVVLAGVMLKMGAYGFLRLAVPFFPQAAVDLAPILLILAVIGITYGAIVAAMQPNLKRIIAYSSIAHLGFVVLGIFALTRQGVTGGVFTMLSHGLTTGALFLLVGMLYERRHTYELADYRGLWKVVPVFGGLFVATTFASIGLPGFSGFVGEFLSLLGAFLTSRWYVVAATTGVILAAVYMLWAVQRAFMGEPDEANRATADIGIRELVTVVPLLGLSLFLGLYPKPVLDRFQPTVRALVAHVEAHSDLKVPPVSDLGPAAVKAEGAQR